MRRLIRAGSMLAALALAVTGCGGSSAASTTRQARAVHRARHLRRGPDAATAPGRLTYHHLFALPAPLRDPASGVLAGGRFVLIGGLDGADVSTDEIDLANRAGLLSSHTLPLAQHDAQAAVLEGKVYVFGGGSATELDHIVAFDPATGSVSTVGSLPQAQSDVAVAQLGGTAYVIGGYNGTDWLSTILAWRPGQAVRVAGHLPVGLRYAAACALDGRVLVLGGSTPVAASDAIYSFDPTTGTARRIGRLPQPVTHASAAALYGSAYLVGGRGDSIDAQTDRVWAIDPLTGAVRAAGRLPQPLSDAGVAALDGVIVVAGGQTPSAVSSQVGELAPAR